MVRIMVLSSFLTGLVPWVIVFWIQSSNLNLSGSATSAILFDVYALPFLCQNDEEVERKDIWEDDKLFINGDFRLIISSPMKKGY